MGKKPNNTEPFWSGYALGALCGGIVTYAFATKKGRETLTKILSHSDTLENDSDKILQLIQTTMCALNNQKK